MSLLIGVLIVLAVVAIVFGLPLFALAVLLMPASAAQSWTRRGRS